MTQVDVLVPAFGTLEARAALAKIASPPVEPFDESRVEAAIAISDTLFADKEAKRYPELQALAFWMRKTAIHKLKKDFEVLQQVPPSAAKGVQEHILLAPRGVVFHVPPANVDTMFVYSWLLAFLTGNSNIVRLSSRQTPQSRVILRCINSACDVATLGTVMLSYGHDLAITQELSSACDVRVIWGGDATVAAIREARLPPHARDLTFPDRFSFSAIRTKAYLELSDKERARVAEKFFNDTYWFDQLGCSSARLLLWVGAKGAEKASELFRQSLRAEIDKRSFSVDASTALHKITFAFRASIDRPVTSQSREGNELMTMALASLEGFDRHHSGAGMFFERVVDKLDELAPFVVRRDQTMTHLGFTGVELRKFASLLNGRGIDRMVPIGNALDFARYWDGYDLLQEYVRRIVITGGQ